MPKGKPWTVELEKQLRELVESGKSAAKIAVVLEKSYASVSTKIKRLGLRVEDDNGLSGSLLSSTLVLPKELPSVEEALLKLAAAMNALEKLEVKRAKKNGKRFNRRLGNWSYGQLSTFIKYKAASTGKTVADVNPKYTSQMCSRCGYTHKSNRRGLAFKCKKCGYELNADLNAARNIAVLGMSEYGRLFVNEPIVASQDSYKPPISMGGN